MILKLKRIRSSCKYIRVLCGLSSSVVWIASVSVRFRSKERVWKTAWKMAPFFILWLSFRFLRSQNQKSHSSVFLCSQNQTETLATQASSSVVHYCDRKTSLHNRCYFFMFSRQAKTHSAKWARSVTRNGGRQQWCVNRQYFFCAFPIMGVSRSKPTLCGLWLAWKTRRNNACYAGCRKTGQFKWAPCDLRLFVVSAECNFHSRLPAKKKEPSLQTGDKNSQALIGQCIFFDHTYIFISLIVYLIYCRELTHPSISEDPQRGNSDCYTL